MKRFDAFVNPVKSVELAIDSKGKSLLDPAGTLFPEIRPYSDVGGLIHKQGDAGKVYTGSNAGKTQARIGRQRDARKLADNHARARAAGFGGVPGMKEGGSVGKAKKSSAPKGRRGDGCARKGHTKGRMR